jgi:hypothetical protein
VQRSYLYISVDGLMDPLGLSQIIPYLPQSEYRKFFIISIEKVGSRKATGSVPKTITGYSWSYYHFSSSRPYKLFTAARMFGRLVYIVLSSRRLVVHCRSFVPALLALPTLLIPRFIANVSLIYDTRGDWPQERRDLGDGLYRFSWFYFISHFFHYLLIKKSSVVIHLSQRAYEESRLHNAKQYVIPCSAESFSESPSFSSRAGTVCSKSPLKFIYIGSTGTYYDIVSIANYLNEISDRYLVEINFYINNLNPNFSQTVRCLRPSIKHEVKVGLNYSDIIVDSREAQFGFCFLKSFPSKYASSPVKFGEYLVNGIFPICTPNFGDIDVIARRLSYPIIFNTENSAVLHFESVLSYVAAQQFSDLELLALSYTYQRSNSIYSEIWRETRD